MKTVSIRTLHDQTGHWIRQAAKQPFVVTDHGRPVACVQPYQPFAARKPLPNRERTLARIPRIDVDSATLVSEDRSRA